MLKWEVDISSLEPRPRRQAGLLSHYLPPRIFLTTVSPPSPASADPQAVDPTVVLEALAASPVPETAVDQSDQMSGIAAISPVAPILAAVSSVASVMSTFSQVTPIVAANPGAVSVAPGET